MKIAVKYVTGANGKTQFVQWPVTEWKKVVTKIEKYEQALKLKSNLKEAFEQVDMLKQSGQKKQTLKEFLNEL